MYLPRLVYLMCVHGGLIVGSQAKRMVEGESDNLPLENNSDWYIVVPYSKWQVIALLIPETSVPNKFGGWRIKEDDVEIDVWPGDPMTYLRECKTKYGGSVHVVDYINNKVFSSYGLKSSES